MKNGLLRLAIVVVVLLGVFGYSFTSIGAGAFIGNMTTGVLNYNTVTEDELVKNAPVNGKVYYIIDCIVQEYTETTSNSGSTSTKTDAYYYLIPFEDDTVMIMKTDADSEFEEQIDDLYYDDEYLMEEGVALDGILVENDDEVLDYFYEWCDDYEMDDVTVVPYTLDCTKTLSERCNFFYLGIVMWLILIGGIVLVIVLWRKSRRTVQPAAVGAYQPVNNFGENNQYNANNMYGAGNQYNANNMYGADNQYQAQQGTGYDPQNTQSSSYIPQQSDAQNSQYIPQSSSNFGFGNSQGSSSNAVDLTKKD